MADTDDLADALPLPAGVTVPGAWHCSRRPSPSRLVFATDADPYRRVVVLPDTSGTDVPPSTITTVDDAPAWTAQATAGFDPRETLAEGVSYADAVTAAVETMRDERPAETLAEQPMTQADASDGLSGADADADESDTRPVCGRCGGTDDIQQTLEGDQRCRQCRADAARRSDTRTAEQAGLDSF